MEAEYDNLKKRMVLLESTLAHLKANSNRLKEFLREKHNVALSEHDSCMSPPRFLPHVGHRSNLDLSIDLHKIIDGQDTRKMLVIKNIPQGVNFNILLNTVVSNHRSRFDFLYLPKENNQHLGYAFINMRSPRDIVTFYMEFNNIIWGDGNMSKNGLKFSEIQCKSELLNQFMGFANKRSRILLNNAQEANNAEEHNIAIQNPRDSYSTYLLECPMGVINLVGSSHY